MNKRKSLCQTNTWRFRRVSMRKRRDGRELKVSEVNQVTRQTAVSADCCFEFMSEQRRKRFHTSNYWSELWCCLTSTLISTRWAIQQLIGGSVKSEHIVCSSLLMKHFFSICNEGHSRGKQLSLSLKYWYLAKTKLAPGLKPGEALQSDITDTFPTTPRPPVFYTFPPAGLGGLVAVVVRFEGPLCGQAQVLGLLVCQLGQLHSQFVQVGSSHLLVQLITQNRIVFFFYI